MRNARQAAAQSAAIDAQAAFRRVTAISAAVEAQIAQHGAVGWRRSARLMLAKPTPPKLAF